MPRINGYIIAGTARIGESFYRLTILERESTVMLNKTTTTLAFAAACLTLAAIPAAQAQYYNQTEAVQPPAMQYEPNVQTQVETNRPQASRGDFGDWSARRNVIESARYDRILESNIGFRHYRMRKECGPITDPQLHAQCLASFQQYEPVMTGSSLPPRRLRHRWEAGY
jgi:hypothetical protein